MPASPGLVLIEAPSRLWRVERVDPPLQFSRINAVDVNLERAGNRFDVPGAGVLYGASSPEGAYAETLAPFRPSASLIAKLAALQPQGGNVAGSVPASWRLERRLRALTVPSALPFVDLDSPATHTALTRSAPLTLLEHGVGTLDVATVRGPDRRLTRALAAWLYGQTDEHGSALYSGIRYESRLGPYECWAIFDGTIPQLLEEQAIELGDPALASVAQQYALTIG